MTIQIQVSRTGLAAIREAGPSHPDIDTAVLEVAGGCLVWSVLDLTAPPVAYLDDVVRAQDWLWVCYGEAVAAAVGNGAAQARTDPARPAAVDDAALLAYALWAVSWWPSSAIDGIPALDSSLLAADIAGLQAECDGLLEDPLLVPELPTPAARRDDYALAAGAEPAAELTLAQGASGTDWRAYPAGLIDAAESAVSWRLVRIAGHTRLRLDVAAAPGLAGPVPAHLWPVAQAVAGGVVLGLELSGGQWTGSMDAPDTYEPIVAVWVPGFGDAGPGDPGRGLEQRARIRALVRARLRAAAAAEPGYLLAEVHAATDDGDY